MQLRWHHAGYVAELVLVLFLWIFLAVVFGGRLASAEVVVYPPIPGAPAGKTYRVVVNDHVVPVQHYNGRNYAWFAFSPPAEVTITATHALGAYRLTPSGKALRLSVHDRSLGFRLNEPGYFVLKTGDDLSEELFLFGDPVETDVPVPGAPNVVSVMDYGADGSGRTDSHEALQRAIDAATARATGGIVYIPPGRYRITKTIFIRSNVHVYVSPGAVLEVPAGVDCCFGYASVLLILDASNVKISGRGVVHGNGTLQSLFFWLMATENTENVAIEDIMLLDGYTTALRLQDTRNARASGLKIFSGSPRLSDGIDIESSQRVTIERCFVYSSDDNIAIGAGTDPRGTVKGVEKVSVRRSVFYQTGTGHTFYIGPHLAPPYIRDITFEENDVISAGGFAAIYPFGGVPVRDVVFRNVRVQEVRDSEPISLYIADCSSWGDANCGYPRGIYGSIHDIRFENVALENPVKKASIAQGYSPDADVKGIRFHNFSISGRLATDPASGRLDIKDHVADVLFTHDTCDPSCPP